MKVKERIQQAEMRCLKDACDSRRMNEGKESVFNKSDK